MKLYLKWYYILSSYTFYITQTNTHTNRTKQKQIVVSCSRVYKVTPVHK